MILMMGAGAGLIPDYFFHLELGSSDVNLTSFNSGAT